MLHWNPVSLSLLAVLALILLALGGLAEEL